MSPVLVTGATGFMGRVLVARLLEEGRAVRVLERRPERCLRRSAGGAGHGRCDAARDAARRLCGCRVRVQPRRRAVLRRQGRGAPAGGERRRPGESCWPRRGRPGAGASCRSRAPPRVGYTEDPARPQDEDSPFPEGAWRNRYARSKRLGEEVVDARRCRGAGRRRRLSRLPARRRRRQPHQHLRGRGVSARLSAHHGRRRALLRRRARRRRGAGGGRRAGA